MTKPASIPLSRPTLATLRERARSVDARPRDIDALLREMLWPLAPGEDARPRADLLHLIIEDPALGGLRGNAGQRVDQVAVRALLALGEPYASELSDTGRRILEQALPRPRPPVPVMRVDVPTAAPVKAPLGAPRSVDSRTPPLATRGVGRPSAPASRRVDSSTPLSRIIGGFAIGWCGVELFLLCHSLGQGLFNPLGAGLAAFVLFVNVYSLVIPGVIIYKRAREAPLRASSIRLNIMMIPVILVVAYLSALFGGSNAMNEAIAHFMMMMGLGAGVRLFVAIGLLALRWSKPARAGRGLPPASDRDRP